MEFFKQYAVSNPTAIDLNVLVEEGRIYTNVLFMFFNTTKPMRLRRHNISKWKEKKNVSRELSSYGSGMVSGHPRRP
jgi:hypothetical protein